MVRKHPFFPLLCSWYVKNLPMTRDAPECLWCEGQGDETAPWTGSSSSEGERAGQLGLVAMRMGRELSRLLVQVRKDGFMR